MNSKFYWVIGAGIGAGIVRLITRKKRKEQEKQDKAMNEWVNQKVKDMANESFRHEEAMKEIREEGERAAKEMHEKTEREMERLRANYCERCENLNLKPFSLKYRDKDGNIHEIDAEDEESFKKVMSNRENTLIFS